MVRGYPLSYALRAYFAGRYHRGRIFHLSAADTLNGGYDSLIQPGADISPQRFAARISQESFDKLWTLGCDRKALW